MKKMLFFTAIFLVAMLLSTDVLAQCSICTKTAMQLGNKPAQGLNAGILYLVSVPYIAIGIIGYNWWRTSKNREA